MKPRMATNIPSQKVQAVGLAAAITTIVVWALRQWAQVEMPTEVAMAVQAVIVVLVGYLTPPSQRDTLQ